jgi:peptidoglycan hydrolase CwlO-like protein
MSEETESIPVQLTRMEGILTLVNYKTDNLVTSVAEHTKDISTLKARVQTLGQEAEAREKTVVQTAQALKEAKEAAEATARAEATKAERTWTLMTRLFAAVAAGSALVAAYGQFHPH